MQKEFPNGIKYIDSLIDLDIAILNQLNNIKRLFAAQIYSAISTSFAHCMIANYLGFYTQSKHYSRRGIEGSLLLMLCLYDEEFWYAWANYSPKSTQSEFLKDDVLEKKFKDFHNFMQSQYYQGYLGSSKRLENWEKLLQKRLWQKSKLKNKEKLKEHSDDLDFLVNMYNLDSDFSVHFNHFSINAFYEFKDNKIHQQVFPNITPHEIWRVTSESAVVWLRSIKFLCDIMKNCISEFTLPENEYKIAERSMDEWKQGYLTEFRPDLLTKKECNDKSGS